MNEKNKSEKEATRIGMIVASVLATCIAAVIIALTIRAVRWILGF